MIKKLTVGIAVLACAGMAVLADTTLTDLTTSRLPTGGVFKVTTDEKLTTMTVNKMTCNTGTFTHVIADSAAITTLAMPANITSAVVSNTAGKVLSYTNICTTLTVSGTVSLPAGGVASAALAGKTDLYTTVTPTIATNANGGTNVVTFTVTDLAGTAATTPTAFRFWISDDAQGTIAAVAGDVAISGGVELQQVVDKGDYWVMCTNLTGTVVATITDTPGGTNYIHALAPCGKITKVVSKFNVP